jgi:hypothetical protein
MGQYNPFKGNIQVVTSNKRKVLVRFDVPTQKIEMTQTFMRSFKGLQLSEEEKREFSKSHREEIKQYQNIKRAVLKEYATEFISQVKKQKDNNFTVQATGIGAYICLAAIVSGKLPESKKFEFHFSEVPLNLFPKQLVKETKSNGSIQIHLEDENTWLRKFKSLTSVPKHLSFMKNKIHQRAA